MTQKNGLRDLVTDVSSYFNGQSVHFFGIDYSGQREADRFLDALAKYTKPSFIFTVSGVGMTDGLDERFGEFRPINGLESYNGNEDTSAFVAAENNVDTGLSAVSAVEGILYGMHQGIIPGRGKIIVYLMTTTGDNVGLSNFAAVSQADGYVGVKRHMRRIMPATYIDLEELGMIPQISERPYKIPRYNLIRSFLNRDPEDVSKDRTVSHVPPVTIETDADFVKKVLRGK